ncbi:MAG: hypothetical protein PF489_06810 [Salinivirgaceae bacterium]|jgi:hypothetical protein|nr:hypothetical protein [Salinivirgaceae bacterium]
MNNRSFIAIALLFTAFLLNSNGLLLAQHTTYFRKELFPDTSLTSKPWSSIEKLDSCTKRTGGFIEKASNNPVFHYENNALFLIGNPHVNIGSTISKDKENGRTLGSGVTFDGKLSNALFFSMDFTAYLSSVKTTSDSRIENSLIPGALWSKNDNRFYNALNINWSAAYEPSDFFLIEMGQKSHFVGDGYHSVILDNEHTPHPFAQFSTSFWKIDYSVSYHLLKDVRWPDFSRLYPKYMTTHSVNFRLHESFHLYAYESVIWKAEDSITNRGYDLSYLNPIIFFRPVEFNLGSPSPDNVLMGAGFRWQPTTWLKLYGQGLIDEFYLKELKKSDGWWANKFAFQGGFSASKKFGEHILNMLAELNSARPFTYSHIQSMQNYGSKAYPLAHPLGANFREILLVGTWSYKRINTIIRISHASVGVDDPDINYGQNIYRSYTDRTSEYGHEILQGKLQKAISGDLNIGYLINKSINLSVSTGIQRTAQFTAQADSPEIIHSFYLQLTSFLTSERKHLYRTSGLYE